MRRWLNKKFYYPDVVFTSQETRCSIWQIKFFVKTFFVNIFLLGRECGKVQNSKTQREIMKFSFIPIGKGNFPFLTKRRMGGISKSDEREERIS